MKGSDRRVRTAFAAILAATVIVGAVRAGVPATCGDLDGSGSLAASDALLLLKKAVGQPVVVACPPCPGLQATGAGAATFADATAFQCGDLDASGTLAASDALLLLKKAVGQNVTISCPACPVTTTTLPVPEGCGNGQRDGPEECEGVDGCEAGSRCSAQCTCAIDEPAPSTSQSLIAAALAAGEIDYPTSLVYRAWALFADSRLPEQYDGEAWQSEDNSLFMEVTRIWNALDAGTRSALRPFVTRPNEPGSYYDPEQQAALRTVASAPADADPVECPYRQPANELPDWRPTGADHFVVWSCGGGDPNQDPHAAKRQIVADMADMVWTEMVGEAGPVKPDALDSGPQPTGRLDIYLVTPHLCKSRGGSCHAIPPGEDDSIVLAGVVPVAPCDRDSGAATSSSIVLLNVDAVTAPSQPWQLRYVFAHEFFHVLQNAHNLEAQGSACGNGEFDRSVSSWLVESTAEWAAWAYFAGDAGDDPDSFFRDFQERDTSEVSLLRYRPEPPYDAYIYPLFVHQEKGDRKAIPKLWKNSSAARTPEQLDDQLGGVLGFAEHFRDFAVRNLNVTAEYFPGDPLPLAQRYQKLAGAAIPENVLPEILQPTVELDFPVDEMEHASRIQPLAAQYERFKVDPNIDYVRLDFDGLGGASHLRADVVVRIGPNWSRRRLPSLTFEFCRDEDPVDEFYLILSNHGHRTGEVVDGDYLITSRFDCPSGWSGGFELKTTLDRTEAATTASDQFARTETVRESQRWTVGGSTKKQDPIPHDQISIRWHGSYERTLLENGTSAQCPGRRLSTSESRTASGSGNDTLTAYAAGGGQYALGVAEPLEENEMTGMYASSFVSCSDSGDDAGEMAPLPEALGLALITPSFAFLTPAPGNPKKFAGSETLIDNEIPTTGGTERIRQVLKWDLYRR